MFGILNLHKPKGVTSRKVVDHVQRLVKPAKAGHAGTLDPLATGVLIVCVGPATRLISHVQEFPKVYRGEFLFGSISDTDDITGNVTEVPNAEAIRNEELETALESFRGEIQQVPPQFSAVHVQGERAYKLARAGKTVEIASKTVTVHRIEILSYEWPKLELEIECGSGTYIRSIGRDLGEHFACGAVMTDLVRTRIGPFELGDAVSIDDLDKDRLSEALISPTKAVAHLPTYQASERECLRLKQGQRILANDSLVIADDRQVAVLTETDELAALAEYNGQTRELRPRQVFLR